MMLHVRVVCPADRTARLASLLAEAAGVTNVVQMDGHARRPDGAAISFDVSAAGANHVLAMLRHLGLDGDGAIRVDRVAAELTRAGPPAGPGRTGGFRGAVRREVVPVWEMVEAAVHEGEAYALSFYWLLAIAGLIGAVGILTNSQVLIVGAMVVSPEYSAIIAVALGVSKLNGQAVKNGLLALGLGFLGAIAATLLFGLAVRAAGQTPEAFTDGVRPVADLINKPDAFSVVVALLAGMAGVISLTEARAYGVIGVLISVVTIPAAASIGLSIAYTEWREVLGSLLQLLLNVLLLIAVGAGGLRVKRWFWRRVSSRLSVAGHCGGDAVGQVARVDEKGPGKLADFRPQRDKDGLAVPPGTDLVGAESGSHRLSEMPCVAAVGLPGGQPLGEFAVVWQDPGHQPLGDLAGRVDHESAIGRPPDPVHPSFAVRAMVNAGRAELGSDRERGDGVAGFVPRGPDDGDPGRAVGGIATAVVALPDPVLVHHRLVVVPDQPGKLGVDLGHRPELRRRQHRSGQRFVGGPLDGGMRRWQFWTVEHALGQHDHDQIGVGVDQPRGTK